MVKNVGVGIRMGNGSQLITRITLNNQPPGIRFSPYTLYWSLILMVKICEPGNKNTNNNKNEEWLSTY